MAPVGSADRGDPRRMARSGEPIMDRGSDASALDWGLSRPRMPGDQQQHPVSGHDRSLQSGIDRAPGSIEIETVKVEHTIGLDAPCAQSTVPSTVERSGLRTGGLRRRLANNRGFRPGGHSRGSWRRIMSSSGRQFARERPDGGGHPLPQFLFLRGERAHAPRFPWAEGSAPAPWPTFRRRFWLRPVPRPRTCRSGWAP